MDNNNIPVQPIPNMQQNIPPQTPPLPPITKTGSKMVFWLIGGLILIILTVGGIYMYLRNTKEAKETPVASTQPVSEKLDDVSETEVEAVGVGDLETEFSSVDQDLKSL